MQLADRVKNYVVFAAVLAALASVPTASADHHHQVSGALTFSSTSLSFGSVTLSTAVSHQIVLTDSSSNNSVTISSIAVSGAGFTASGVSDGQIVNPGQTATLTVTFDPASAGVVAGAVTITADSQTQIIALSGTGVSVVSNDSVTVSWAASTSQSVVGYNVYCGTVSGGPYDKLTAAPTSGLSYLDTVVQSGDTYYYVVTSVNADGMESAYSSQASATAP